MACLRTLTVVAALWLLSTSSTAYGEGVTRIRATTSEEIINAILAATSSGVPTVILVAPGHYQFSGRFDSEFGPSRLPPITTTITLQGEDAATTILDGQPAQDRARLITVVTGGRLTVRGLTLTRGIAAIVNTDGELQLENSGGAAANFGGFLRFVRCVISHNSAGLRQGALGGGILSIGHLQIEHTTLENNFAKIGGGIALFDSTATITRSLIRNNQSGDIGFGGAAGILVGGGSIVTITGSTIARNIASTGDNNEPSEGGGISNGGTLKLVNSAVVENATLNLGSGGGIFNAGHMTIYNSTIGGNSAVTSGGGIYNTSEAQLRMRGVTIARNHAAGRADEESGYPRGCHFFPFDIPCTGGGGIFNEPANGRVRVRMTSTVIANNTNGGPQQLGPDCAGVIDSRAHSAFGTGVDCVGFSPNDQVNVDPRLEALEDNGAPGHAHFELQADSPLIDMGGRVGEHCTPRDQIGRARNDGNNNGTVRCDVGAIEFQSTGQ